jgi:hypothetical protein
MGGCSQTGERMTASQDEANRKSEIENRQLITPKPIAARDWMERDALHRSWDLKLIDRLLDRTAEPAPFNRPLPPAVPANAEIVAGVTALDDRNPFPERIPLSPKEVTVHVGIAASTIRTRENAEVLAAAQPFIDLEQREYNVRGVADLWDKPDEIYFGLIEGHQQLAVSHVFDYLLVRAWLAQDPSNGVMPLAWVEPGHATSRVETQALPGPAGTSVMLIVSAASTYHSVADLHGARLSIPARDTYGPGVFLTQLLSTARQPRDAAFFGTISLRRYSKDAVLDVLKGLTDAACVDEGTVAALQSFYGLGSQLRTIATSPRYNVDVLYTSANNLPGYETEINLTQQQLATLGLRPEGQEVLSFFDIREWHAYQAGSADDVLAPAREAFADFLNFRERTPVDLKILLDPKAAVDLHTYDRYGNP